MNLQYFFSSATGDIPLGPSELALPFKIALSEVHPFLTLQDYFDAIAAFLCMDEGKRLHAILERELHRPLGPGRILRVRLFSEKHGVLYHVARAEIACDAGSVALAVSTAVTPEAKAHLDREYETLRGLEKAFPFAFLPKVFCSGHVRKHTPGGEADLSFLLAQWLEDYHEWHLAPDRDGGGHGICIWDQTRGRRFASPRETRDIFRQASKILTLYYDTRSYCQIYPWHHAAGDFVVKNNEGVIDVKLTTARRYAPFMNFIEDEKINPLVALIYFFLDLTIRMRLDKVDGIRDLAWAGDHSIEAATEGFFEALEIMTAEKRFSLGGAVDVIGFLKSFTGEEIHTLFQPLLGYYREENLAEFSVIRSHLQDHIMELHQVIQRFHK